MWSRYRAQIVGAPQGGRRAGQGVGHGGRGGRKIGFDKSSTSWNVLGVSKPSGNSVVGVENAFKTGKVNKKLPHHGTFQASQSPLAIQLFTLKALPKKVMRKCFTNCDVCKRKDTINWMA